MQDSSACGGNEEGQIQDPGSKTKLGTLRVGILSRDEKGRARMKAKPKIRQKRGARVTEGGGNVFADLGLPNPEQELLKAQLTLQIYTILKDSGMRQVEIARILGVQQPQVLLLMRNRAGNFSVGRLMEFLMALRRDVEITVRPARKEHGALSVVSA
jgi:predicted XRE-type DNA-binding protein